MTFKGKNLLWFLIHKIFLRSKNLIISDYIYLNFRIIFQFTGHLDFRYNRRREQQADLGKKINPRASIIQNFHRITSKRPAKTAADRYGRELFLS